MADEEYGDYGDEEEEEGKFIDESYIPEAPKSKKYTPEEVESILGSISGSEIARKTKGFTKDFMRFPKINAGGKKSAEEKIILASIAVVFSLIVLLAIVLSYLLFS